MSQVFPARSGPSSILICGFLAGALAVPLFHQIGLVLLSFVRGGPVNVFSMRPAGALGVPQIFNLMFWGGVWGVVYALIEPKFSLPGWAKGLIFGATLPVLAGWFIFAPLRGQPVAAGWELSRMIWSPIINGIYGVGVGSLYPVIRIWLRR